MNKYQEAIDIMARYISDCKCGIKRYGDREIDSAMDKIVELEKHCDKLEKAIDKACTQLVNLKEAADCFEYDGCPFREECKQAICGKCYKVESWKEWLMKDEDDNQ